jgi:hypothetical protein
MRKTCEQALDTLLTQLRTSRNLSTPQDHDSLNTQVYPRLRHMVGVFLPKHSTGFPAGSQRPFQMTIPTYSHKPQDLLHTTTGYIKGGLV